MTTHIPREAARYSGLSNKDSKYLTFNLGECGYGISILKIKEIIGLMEVTAVPQTADYIKGVINLRGQVIPIIDLRRRFGMAPADYTERTCIIVVQIETPHKGTVPMGIVVDSVNEVQTIKADDIEPPPNLAGGVHHSFIQGLAKINDGIKILLNINHILAGHELEPLAEMPS